MDSTLMWEIGMTLIAKFAAGFALGVIMVSLWNWYKN